MSTRKSFIGVPSIKIGDPILKISLEPLTEHTVADTTTQKKSRSCVLGGISLKTYSIAIESGDSLEVGMGFYQELESFFKKRVKYLFLSHTHSDHRNGIDAFKDCTLIASQKCMENMPKRMNFRKWSKEIFDKKFVLEEHGLSIEFYHVGGHAIGSSIAYFPHEKVLFAGDLFIVGSINFGLPFMSFYQNKPKRTGNPEEYLAAFALFKSMEIEIIVPGHGDLVLNPQEYLDGQISFYNSLKSFFTTMINEGKRLEEIELPRLEPIEQAYRTAENRPQKSRNVRFLENYLHHLKTSFYNYYSGKFTT